MPDTAPTPQALMGAAMLPVNLSPSTVAAEALVDTLMVSVAAQDAAGRSYKRGPAQAEKFRRHVAAIIGGLLVNHGRPVSEGGPALSYRPTQNKDVPLSPLTRRQFEDGRDALVACGFIGTQKSHTDFISSVGERGWGERRAVRMWPSGALLAAASEAGVPALEAHEHFQAPEGEGPPAIGFPCVLRGLGGRKGGTKVKGLELPWPDTEAARKLAADVEAHNAFAATVDISGCSPPRWNRTFSGSLDQHGRWYVPGKNTYQNMKEAERVSLISINGEGVAELDIRASHLSFLYARSGSPLNPDADPYACCDLPRWVVKAWITATLGDGVPCRRWSPDAAKKARDKGRDLSGHKPAIVGAEVLRHHPILSRIHEVLASELAGRQEPPERLVGLLMMAAEARALTAAMASLRESTGILSLPMHDGLIVARSAVAEARSALRLAVEEHMDFVPHLDVAQQDHG